MCNILFVLKHIFIYTVIAMMLKTISLLNLMEIQHVEFPINITGGRKYSNQRKESDIYHFVVQFFENKNFKKW